MKVIINKQEYELKEMNTKIYIDILYAVYYAQTDSQAFSTDLQVDLLVDATGIEKEKLYELHPEEFLNIVEKVSKHYADDPFWGNTPDKKSKIVKLKKK